MLNWRRPVQSILMLLIRPYVVRELPGWGFLLNAIADYRKDWLWAHGPIKVVRGKVHNYLMELDLSKWPDRSTFFLGRWYDLELQLLLQDIIRPGDTVVDVGANRGMFALTASRLVGNNGKIICFEPNPRCYEILERETASNKIDNIQIIKVGLGDRNEELELIVPKINSGEGTFGASIYEDFYRVPAKIIRGDDALSLETPRFIKIDVEGFECRTIEGLSETIKKHHPIIITEIIDYQLRSCGYSAQELMRRMEAFGYRGFKLGLKKDSGRYTWSQEQLNPDETVDALWVHPEGNCLHLHPDSVKLPIEEPSSLIAAIDQPIGIHVALDGSHAINAPVDRPSA